MLRHNSLTYSGKIIIQIIGKIVFFPLWWYTVGFSRTVKNLFHFWSQQEKSLGFSIWLKNIFVPMYGQNDSAGRLISFIVRLIQILVRGLALLFWLFVVLALILIWLFLPVLLFLAIAFQIF